MRCNRTAGQICSHVKKHLSMITGYCGDQEYEEYFSESDDHVEDYFEKISDIISTRRYKGSKAVINNRLDTHSIDDKIKGRNNLVLISTSCECERHCLISYGVKETILFTLSSVKKINIQNSYCNTCKTIVSFDGYEYAILNVDNQHMFWYVFKVFDFM
jgi:hypothetical protein